ncbi:MAG: sigma-70 family RNA polymerase sigma factor [Flavobacteriaceae bacterium]|nr:sigma-70 family RNA polymerase sigma factor [Flavobacteriaceae bacterium]
MQNQKTSDNILVKNYMDGNERSLEILIGRHKQKIYGFIYSKIADADVVEDIFQDTFIKVINTLKAGKYNEQGKFLPWVMRIAHNLIIDHFRKEKRAATFKNTDEFDIFSVISDGSLNAEKQIIKDQVHHDVRRIVDELSEEQREVLMMRIYRDMSFKEIAEITGTSINTALGRMRYALINTRKIMERHNIALTY